MYFKITDCKKDVKRHMSKKSCFRSPFNRQHGKWSQDPLKSARQHLYHIYWSLWWKLSWRKSLLVICKILGLFLNTLTAVDEYSLLYSNNLTKPIQMELFKKQKTVCQLFAACLKFWTFWKKKCSCISEMTDWERRG